MLHTFGTSDVVIIAIIVLLIVLGISLHFVPRRKWPEADQ